MLSTSTQILSAAVAADRPRALVPFAGLDAVQAMSAPIAAAQGTAVPAAGRTAAGTALGAATANPGSPPRPAPV